MFRRSLDIALATAALIVLSPVLAVAAVAIRLSSRGPVFYRAQRVGKDGGDIVVLKLRTMHLDHGEMRSAITAGTDPRIFPVGTWLRRAKIDELPQLVNIIRGDMAIVGPRPEDRNIVRDHYRPEYAETLRVLPGLSSPGSLYYYTTQEEHIPGEDPEAHYVERILPIKLALDTVYVRRASLVYDLRLIGRTIRVILGLFAGRKQFDPPPELEEARRILDGWSSGLSSPRRPSFR